MRNSKIYIVVIAFLLIGVIKTSAVPAYPFPIKMNQPDGTVLTVMLKGDEYHHYHETEDGYLLIKNKDGVFHYGQLKANGIIEDTGVKANEIKRRNYTEKQFVKTLTQNIDMSKINSQMRQKREAPANISPKQNAYPLVGKPRSLVILVNFKDVSFVIDNPKVAFHNLLNEEGYSKNDGTGSARDYFRDASMGIFEPEFDIYGPYTLPENMSYYGGNDRSGSDSNPAQMVIDACRLAHDDGVDFTLYDTDNDKMLDNVFIYYAGYNEAEGGADNTIWPHRWAVYPGYNYTGSVASTTFDGVRVYDYACTSELKSYRGANMAGIGTFTHEFGHVLGLPDFYATNNAAHHTLSSWSIMDAGTYLNGGNTPPTYSAFERMMLGYIKPTILTDPITAVLSPITSSNQAYLIAENDEHNLKGGNLNISNDTPNPKEFFLLENRQNTGWDKYLPGHGMLIYHINYDQNDFRNNTVNNDPNKMGVDIIEADGRANRNNMAGDPFPGTQKVTEFTPKLRNKTELDKPITHIAEVDKDGMNIISFRYRGGGDFPIIFAENNIVNYETTLSVPSEVQTINISGENLVSNIKVEVEPNEHFEIKLHQDGEKEWRNLINLTVKDNIVAETQVQIRYNPLIATGKNFHEAKLTIKSENAETIEKKIYGRSKYPYEDKLLIKNNENGFTIYPAKDKMEIFIYDLHGRLIKTIFANKQNPIEIVGLQKNAIYLIKSGDYFNKIIF